MNHYIDWEFYNSLFSDVTEAEFDRIIPRATALLDANTHMKVRAFVNALPSSDLTDFQTVCLSAIKLTCCNLVNLLASQDNTAIGTGITSVSNDGYSESYKVVTQAEKTEEVLHCIRSGLIGTGLGGAI